MTASLALSNNAPHVARSSVFAVYNNLAPTPSVASYPTGFPGQFTVAGSRKPTAAGAAAQVSVAYYQGGFGAQPALFIGLANNGTADLTYTLTHHQYSADGPRTYQVRPGHQQRLVVDPLAHSFGWYDLTPDPRVTRPTAGNRPKLSAAALERDDGHDHAAAGADHDRVEVMLRDRIPPGEIGVRPPASAWAGQPDHLGKDVFRLLLLYPPEVVPPRPRAPGELGQHFDRSAPVYLPQPAHQRVTISGHAH